jgi:hypothetical protein
MLKKLISSLLIVTLCSAPLLADQTKVKVANRLSPVTDKIQQYPKTSGALAVATLAIIMPDTFGDLLSGALWPVSINFVLSDIKEGTIPVLNPRLTLIAYGLGVIASTTGCIYGIVNVYKNCRSKTNEKNDVQKINA